MRCTQCQQPIVVSDSARCATHPEVKAVAPCARCGTFGCGVCLTQNGNRWLCGRCGQVVVPLPWDDRQRLGLWRAWWETSIGMMLRPTQTLQGASPDGTIGSSLGYAMLSTIVGFSPTLMIYGFIFAGSLLLTKDIPDAKDFPVPLAVMIPMGMVLYGGLLLGFQIMSIFVLAGFDYVGLTILGTTPHSYRSMIRAYALSMAPYLCGLVPFVGLYAFPVWSIVLRIFAAMHFQKATAGRATLAIILPVLLLCTLGAIGTVILISGLFGAMRMH